MHRHSSCVSEPAAAMGLSVQEGNAGFQSLLAPAAAQNPAEPAPKPAQNRVTNSTAAPSLHLDAAGTEQGKTGVKVSQGSSSLLLLVFYGVALAAQVAVQIFPHFPLSFSPSLSRGTPCPETLHSPFQPQIMSCLYRAPAQTLQAQDGLGKGLHRDFGSGQGAVGD